MVTANQTALMEANFNPKIPTKFIVHGFIDTGFSSWVIKMAQSLVKDREYNVIAVDWGAGSLPLYTQATANARLVGLEVGYFINYLKVILVLCRYLVRPNFVQEMHLTLCILEGICMVLIMLTLLT